MLYIKRLFSSQKVLYYLDARPECNEHSDPLTTLARYVVNMAVDILTDYSFLLNDLFYLGSFLFDLHEDAYMFFQAAPYSNEGACVLMAGCFIRQARQGENLENRKLWDKRSNSARLNQLMHQCCIGLGPLPFDAAWCCGAFRELNCRLFNNASIITDPVANIAVLILQLA